MEKITVELELDNEKSALLDKYVKKLSYDKDALLKRWLTERMDKYLGSFSRLILRENKADD